MTMFECTWKRTLGDGTKIVSMMLFRIEDFPFKWWIKKLIKQKFRDITFNFFGLKNIWHRYLTLVAYIVVYVSRLFSLFGGFFLGGGSWWRERERESLMHNLFYIYVCLSLAFWATINVYIRLQPTRICTR